MLLKGSSDLSALIFRLTSVPVIKFHDQRRLLGLEGAHLQHAVLDVADDPDDHRLCHARHGAGEDAGRQGPRTAW
jgi:hypothetical protein